MTAAAHACWERRTVAGESVVEAGIDAAVLLVGRGPRAVGPAPEARMEAVLAALPGARAVRWCQQIHGRAMAAVASEPDRPLRGVACVGRGDGLLTDEPGVALAVWTADCVPVLLAGGGVVAAVHAGWRGAAAGLAASAVRRIENEYGVAAERVTAVLGPAVGVCHYPVGPEVIEALSATGMPEELWRRADRVDVRAHVAAQLARAGIRPQAIAMVGGCTACDPALASYRRDGASAGRQLSLVLLPEG